MIGVIFFFSVIGMVFTVPLWIISFVEKHYDKKLYILHILYNALFVLPMIHWIIWDSTTTTTSAPKMMHAPTLELFLALLLLPAYPLILLFYLFGIKFIKHYFLESYKYVRYGLIVIYAICTAPIIWTLFMLILYQ